MRIPCLSKSRGRGARIARRVSLRSGFTLIELMVAVSIFAIVMVMSMSAVFTIIAANRKAQAVSSVIDNLNFAVESMTRTIKTNSDYVISAGGSSVTVTDDDAVDDPTLTYSFDSANKRILFTRSGTPVPITAPEVTVDSFEVFRIFDDGASDCDQPMVAIAIRGSAGVDESSRTEFSLQTVVSQRDLRIKTSCL